MPHAEANATLQEGERVMKTFKNHLHLPVTVVDDSERMLKRLKVRSWFAECHLFLTWQHHHGALV